MLLQKEVLYQSRGEKSQVVQLELEMSCKTSFIPHAQSPAAAEEQKKSEKKKSRREKLLFPVPYKCLVKQPPVEPGTVTFTFKAPLKGIQLICHPQKWTRHRQCLCCQNCWILSKYLTSPHTLFFQFLVLVPESCGAPNEPAHFCLWTGSVLRLLWVTARRQMI